MNQPIKPPRPLSYQTKHFQPKSGFFQAAVPPLTLSQLRLPGGQIEPYYYSLGVDSTIPFISLQGGGATQKTFTWGEMIEVMPGQTVTVKNESYMQGDIQINSGHDYAAKPERISLPVTTEFLSPDPFFPLIFGVSSFVSVFPADTRRCRRAYLKFQLQTNALNSVLFTFIGKPQKHSFPGIDSVTGAQTYTQFFSIPPATTAGSIPMGYGEVAIGSLEPMGLTDQVSFRVSFDPLTPPTFLNTLYFYCLEY